MSDLVIVPVRPPSQNNGTVCQNNCVVVLQYGETIEPDSDIPPDGWVFVYALGEKVYVGFDPVLVPVSFSNM